MSESISRIITLSARNIKEILREPLSLVFTLALPLVMQIGFYFIFHQLTSQFEMKHLTPGIVVFSQSFLTLFTGMLIATDKSTTFLTRLFVSKTKPFEFIISYVLSVLPIVFVQSVLFFVVGAIIDSTIISINILGCILASLITALVFINLGVLFGALCGEKSIGGISSIVITGQSVLSGMWFPTEGLQGGFVTLMNCMPFRNATLLLQNLLNGIFDFQSDFLLPLTIVLAYGMVSLVIGVFVFRKKVIEG